VTELTTQASLRERKKARTRAAIREHAVRLFREQGYQATTVEQIAAAAEVSPSTFFRYFPTKEDVVLQDDMDLRLLEMLSKQPPGMAPLAAIRAAVREAVSSFGAAEMAQFAATTELMMTVPEVRARAMDEFARTIEVIAEAVGQRAGRSPQDMAVRVFAGAVVGVIMSVSLPWHDLADRKHTMEMFAGIDEALALLESGLPL
jgi:AcrR family transcriptional regulator